MSKIISPHALLMLCNDDMFELEVTSYYSGLKSDYTDNHIFTTIKQP